MELLRQIKNSMERSLGIFKDKGDKMHLFKDEGDRIHLFILTDEKGKMVDSFRVFTNAMNLVHIFVSTKQRCTVDYIETIVQHKLYKVHAHDQNGKERTFKMERIG